MGSSAKIIQRLDAIRKDGTAPLYLRYTINRVTGKISLHLSVKPDEFDSDQERVVLADEKKADDYNLLLGMAKAKANEIFVDYRLAERQLTVKDFKREFENPSVKNDFIAFMEREAMDHKYIVQPQTIKTYFTTINWLKRWRRYINFLDITPDWPDQFERWMIKNGLSRNNRAKQHKNAKKFIKLAIRRGVRIANPYENFPIRFNRSDPVYLAHEELEKLHDLWDNHLLPDYLHEDLRKFLFVCYTGPRYSDLRKLTADNIVDGYLIYAAQKTIRFNHTVKVPLTETAKSYIDMSRHQLFDNKELQPYNVNLKEIGAIAGLKKRLTSHVARHTFAVSFLEAGGKVETLKELLGHSKIETTMIYVHVTDKRKEREIKGMERKKPR